MTERRTGVPGPALIAIVLTAGLALAGCTEDTSPAGGEAFTSAAATPTPTESSAPATSSAPPESTTDAPDEHSGGPAEAPRAEAASAPKDASVGDFCDSFDPADISRTGGDVSRIEATQQDMLAVGTPADLSPAGRAGWEWFVSIDDTSDWQNMSNDDMADLFVYHSEHC